MTDIDPKALEQKATMAEMIRGCVAAIQKPEGGPFETTEQRRGPH